MAGEPDRCVASLRMPRKARGRIDRDYREDIGIATFSARFAEITGMSPTRYRAETTRPGGPPPYRALRCAYVSELAPRGQVREPAWMCDLMRNYY